MKCAEYMRQFIGVDFKGYITGMNNSGLFVELDNVVSGKVAFETMNDYYFVDDNCFNAAGRRKGKRYSLGDTVEVTVIDTNKDAGEISLEIKSEKRFMGRQARRKIENKKNKRRRK